MLIGNTVTILGRDAGLGGTVRWDNSVFLPSGPVLGAEVCSVAPEETGIIYSSNK